MSDDTALAGEPPTRGQEASFTYDAFLSYSHQDQAVAAGIQKGLHRIGRRVGQLNALRVFRDTTDRSANPNLWGRVTVAMDRSRYLIVVLSSQAAESEWVNKEVAHWLEQRGPDQRLIVVAEGHLQWDEATDGLTLTGPGPRTSPLEAPCRMARSPPAKPANKAATAVAVLVEERHPGASPVSCTPHSV